MEGLNDGSHELLLPAGSGEPVQGGFVPDIGVEAAERMSDGVGADLEENQEEDVVDEENDIEVEIIGCADIRLHQNSSNIKMFK